MKESTAVVATEKCSEPQQQQPKLGVAPSPNHEYDFSRSYIGDKQLDSLAAHLASDAKLRAVCLRSTGLRDKGTVALCEQLRNCPRLEKFDISENRFSLPGAQACLELLQSCPRLGTLVVKDTCLDADFCEKRGLGSQYRALQLQVNKVLQERSVQQVSPRGPRPLQPKPPVGVRQGNRRPMLLSAVSAQEVVEPQLARTAAVA
mmetsp:Transcript_22719/g.53007  ORF Transcript_22719/g.53007 Transcript_22719/m.53007 type:complete len:204 (-) Transcript_22719:64-675(-)